MPRVFFCAHPVGSVIGRADYKDGFYFYQGCTVGENLPSGNGHPKFGENVLLCSNAKVIGSCSVGNNVIISANSYIKDIEVPNDTIVFGQYPDIIFKPNNGQIKNFY